VRQTARLFLSCLIILSCVSSAHSASVSILTHKPSTQILLHGELEPGDLEKVDRINRHTPISTMILASPGGSAAEGIRIGLFNRRNRIATHVSKGQICASACFLAYIGGIIRTVGGGAKMGVHMHSAAFNESYIKTLRSILLAKQYTIDDRIRLIVLLNEQMSAVVASNITGFITRMGVSIGIFDPMFQTNHLEVYWLNSIELQQFNVVNTEG
jgi:hypothetical protein